MGRSERLLGTLGGAEEAGVCEKGVAHPPRPWAGPAQSPPGRFAVAVAHFLSCVTAAGSKAEWGRHVRGAEKLTPGPTVARGRGGGTPLESSARGVSRCGDCGVYTGPLPVAPWGSHRSTRKYSTSRGGAQETE